MHSLRRLTWLLFALLLSLALWVWEDVPLLDLRLEPQPQVVMPTSQTVPEVVLPTGALAEVYERARPATLRIEARLRGHDMTGPIGVGTGFFFSDDGLVLTAFHVVDVSEIQIEDRSLIRYVGVTPDEREYPLRLVGFDAYLDLAVLQAEVPSKVAYLPLGSALPQVDSEVVAIGNSRGEFLQGRAGRIARLGVASPRARFATDTIELTAALLPGDSGGPVLNDRGEAVGVVSYISFNPNAVPESEQGDLIPDHLRDIIRPDLLRPNFASYAVPVLAESTTVTALVAGERHDIPVIGLSFPNPAIGNYQPGRSSTYLGRQSGAVVSAVQPGGPAELAGFRPLEAEGGEIVSADVIIAVDGERTPTVERLIDVLYHKEVGQTVTVTVQRGAETFRVRMTLAAKQEVFN